MVETRAALGAEDEKETQLSTASAASTHRHPFSPRRQGPKAFRVCFLQHILASKNEKKNSQTNPTAIYDTCAVVAARHTHSDKDADPPGTQQQKRHFEGCTASRPNVDFEKKAAPHLDESNNPIRVPPFSLDNTHGGK